MNTPRKETLFERAVRLERQNSADRLSQLERMKGRLALLEPFMTSLAAHGLVIRPTEIEDTEEGPLRPMPVLMSSRHAHQVMRVFKDHGFNLVKRSQAYTHGPFKNVVLANGSLELVFTVDADEAIDAVFAPSVRHHSHSPLSAHA